MPTQTSRVLVFGALFALSGTLAAQGNAPDVSLTRELVRRGEDTVLTVGDWGRYAVLVESKQGAGVTVVDRMTGPGASAGVEGVSDGRLDLLLERGDYKLRLNVAKEDEARVSVRRFEERSGATPPLLPDGRMVRTELGDFQQRSWWVELDDEALLVEVAGRDLADLRLWRDGSWLEAVTPSCDLTQPEPGRPLRTCQLVATPGPGLYLVTAYGGPALAWTEGPDAHPLYVRRGIPSLPEAGRSPYVISPFGVDRYLVPAGTRYARVELPQADRCTLTGRSYDASRPYRADGTSASITTESRVPVAEVNLGGEEKVLTVSGRAGQRYTLQHFAPAGRNPTLKGEGRQWVGTLHSGFAGDNLDATGLLIHTVQGKSEVVASQALVFDGDTAWKRRFNLMGRATMYVEVKEAGTWRLKSTGTAAVFSIDPMFPKTPQSIVGMTPRPGPEIRWELDPGFYVLTMTPSTPGIAEVEIRAAGALDRMIDAVGLGADAVDAPRAGVAFPGVDLTPTGTWSVYVGEQPEVKVGLVTREYPLDLSQALPLVLRAGESVRLPARVGEAGTLAATSDAGKPLRVSVDDGVAVPGPKVKAGDHWVQLTNEDTSTAIVSLVLRPTSREPDAPLPALDAARLAALPHFPVLDASAPKSADLAPGEYTTWRVVVEEPGLYALRSTGLLRMQGDVRTRLVTSFRSDAEGGPGRNFEVLDYLGQGDYQLTVRPLGQTQGHFGVELARATLHEGGELSDGVPGRAEVGAGEGVVYTFAIEEKGHYRVRSFGVGRNFRCRLEDGEGWPVVAPGAIADLELELEPGDYRMIVLPEPEPGRRLTVFERVEELPLVDGHGPLALRWDLPNPHIWKEPVAGQERVPDVWTFTLPASADVGILLSGEMVGEILGADGQRFARTTPGEAWQGRLPAGAWRLEVRNGRRDNGVRYTVQVLPVQLVAGLSRDLSVPTQIGVAVGESGLYELGSLGGSDVRARLYDATGALIADVDDRPLDWNFRMVQRLEPGDYTLRLDPVAVTAGRTRVSMRARVEKQQPELRLPAVLAVVPGESVQLIPLVVPPEAELIALLMRSAESVGAALEARVGERWVSVATAEGTETRLEARTGGQAKAWRLRLWSLDLRGNPVDLRVDAVRASRLNEGALARGINAGPSSKAVPAMAALAVKLDRPGVFLPEERGLRWCPRAGEGCVEAPEVGIAEPQAELWLVARGGEDKRIAVAARRVVVGAEPVRVSLEPGRAVALDLAAAKGPVVALARGSGVQPGVQVRSQDALSKPAAGGVLELGENAALSVGIGLARPAVALWSARGGEVTVQQRAFAAPEPKAAAVGAVDDALAPGQAMAYTLPEAGTLRLVLDEGLVAVLTDERGTRSVHWAERGALQERVYGARGVLTLLNPGFDAALSGAFRFELSRDERQVGSVGVGRPFEELAWEGGRLRLPVEGGEGGLHVRGPLRAAALVSPDGGIQRGADLSIGVGGGELVLDLDPGLVVVWKDRPGEEGKDLWAAAQPGSARTVSTPSTVTLSGTVQRLRLSAAEAGVLSLRAGAPLVVAVQRGTASPEVHALQAGGALDVWVTAGELTVDLRGYAGAPLSGQLSLSLVSAVPLGEGPGPEVVLGAGETRLYRFTVKESGTVGFGLRASADGVDATLLDGQGLPLAHGLMGMRVLEAGDYLLVVHVAPAGRPIHLQPVLAGVTPPSSGPPPEVIRSYLELAGLAPVQE